jgi:hypothetical protein
MLLNGNDLKKKVSTIFYSFFSSQCGKNQIELQVLESKVLAYAMGTEDLGEWHSNFH